MSSTYILAAIRNDKYSAFLFRKNFAAHNFRHVRHNAHHSTPLFLNNMQKSPSPVKTYYCLHQRTAAHPYHIDKTTEHAKKHLFRPFNNKTHNTIKTESNLRSPAFYAIK